MLVSTRALYIRRISTFRAKALRLELGVRRAFARNVEILFISGSCILPTKACSFYWHYLHWQRQFKFNFTLFLWISPLSPRNHVVLWKPSSCLDCCRADRNRKQIKFYTKQLSLHIATVLSWCEIVKPSAFHLWDPGFSLRTNERVSQRSTQFTPTGNMNRVGKE